MTAFWFPVATIVCALACTGTANAAESAWLDTGKAQVKLHADATRAAVEIRLRPKWHTYWRYPGDAGVPPRLDWNGSENLAEAQVFFPAPRRFVEAAGQVIGYEDRVFFPVKLKPADASKPLRLKLRFDFAVCEKICIPGEADFVLDVPAGEPKSAVIDEAESKLPLPKKIGDSGMPSVNLVKLVRGAKPYVTVEVRATGGMLQDLFAEGPSADWALPLPEKVSADGDSTRYKITLDGAPPGTSPIPASIRLTFYAGKDSIVVDAPLD